jgi:hypothetical protein
MLRIIKKNKDGKVTMQITLKPIAPNTTPQISSDVPSILEPTVQVSYYKH